MECNKEEAVRARAIAEKRFSRKDIIGAKKFAMKAQGLYPELEGIQQMIATFDVYIASEKKIHGDSDWYAILNVHPSADDDTVRKHYRKLALLLHPDKNKTIGAEGAFKCISQAWSLLSDKGKRSSYDLLRNSRVSMQPSSSVPSESPTTNGYNKFGKATTARGPKGSSKVPPNPKPKQDTFWTACYRCKMQYEYLRKYLNNNLLCPNCRKAFFAIETGPPRDRAVKPSAAQWSFSQQNSTHQSESSDIRSGRNKAPTASDKLGNFSSPGSDRQTNYTWNTFTGPSSASTPARAAVMVQQAYETVKREREEAQAAKKREEALKRKANATKRTSSVQPGLMKRKRSTDDVGTSNHGNESANRRGTGGLVGACRSKLADCSAVRFSGPFKSKGGNEISPLGIRYMLIEKATKDVQKHLDRSMNTSKSVEKDDRNDERQLPEEKENENMGVKCSRDISFHSSTKDDVLLEVKRLKLSKTSSEKFIDVPDPNFHVFDRDRDESSFEEDQVWAAYDDNDGMPRLYAIVHKVISRVPFELEISWLNANIRGDLGLWNTVGSEYVKACGEFRAGRRIEKADSLECFSHKVKWRKGKDGMIQIFPRRGDVWALYRNWSPEWDELTIDEMISKYDLVEVLEDLMEEGVTIIPLVKVAGFRTVFHRHLDLGQIRTIPQEEICRFSHRVPSFVLTGADCHYALKGCHELDPSAVPSQLLQAFCDMNEEDVATLMDYADHSGTDEVKKISNHKRIDEAENTNEADMVQSPVKDRHDAIQLNMNETQAVCVLDDSD